MQRDPERSEYLLTDKGRELAPVIIALTEWGDRWAAPDGPPILYTHSTCGGPVGERTTCGSCGQAARPLGDPRATGAGHARRARCAHG